MMQRRPNSCETVAVDLKGDDDSKPAVSYDKSSPANARGSNKQCSNGGILCDRKWEYRPPPRGLTPNEYVLCHR